MLQIDSHIEEIGLALEKLEANASLTPLSTRSVFSLSYFLFLQGQKMMK